MLAWTSEDSVFSLYFTTDFPCGGGGGCKHSVRSVTLIAEISFSPKFSTGIWAKDAERQREIIQMINEIV